VTRAERVVLNCWQLLRQSSEEPVFPADAVGEGLRYLITGTITVAAVAVDSLRTRTADHV